MGAVAAALRELGYQVTGSDDQVYPPMSTFLAERRIPIFTGYKPENLPVDTDIVVIGNAISRGNLELEAVLNRKLLYRSLPEVLREFFLQGKTNIVVTGTHGKTTTTSLLTYVLRQANLGPSYLVGGLAKDLGQGAAFSDSQFFVLEGDEYDTAFFDKRSKFLHYLPETVVINNIEFDHADIFKDIEEIKLTFRRLVNIVPGSGEIFINSDDRNCESVVSQALAKVTRIGTGPESDLRITDIRYDASGSRFVVDGQEIQMPQIGEFNLRNAAMAYAVARRYGIHQEIICSAIAKFRGVARRQELRGEVNGIKVIDDFGHHPTAIKATLEGLRFRFPGQRLWAVFEPRSNTTRRAVFQQSLPAALAAADGVVLARVNRLETLPADDRLDPNAVVEAVRKEGKPAFYEAKSEDIVARLKPLAKSGDVVVVFSNGGFDGIHEKLLQSLAD
jgi:UDP-N-acetylmuramate: L-alanyl-gamma-D-glutamyl-meso-diaminopimelate ligase